MSEKILTAAILLVAILATVPAVAEAVPYTGLALVVLGLVAGIMGGDSLDVQHRVAYYVLAATLPMTANCLDAIPVAGAWLNGVLDHFAVALQGYAVALVILQLKSRLMAAA